MAGQKTDLFEIVLHCLFVMPDFLPMEKRFDVQVLTLTLMINLMVMSFELNYGVTLIKLHFLK